ncbi:DEAD/DEAH box helicase [Limnoglobus roseus]|uniref:RNA helicase n=1 Tax=Limnoglobus roseus TaxID=2598579 RepID=A0A5C1A8S8_9BACT|nr:DEAD/DEAH box helicase [Limnoglobus roseus]QEL13564.1 heavy metal transporter [Limnoglobus roseus]
MSDEMTAIPATGFAALGLDARLLSALETLNYKQPSPIQEQAIPHVRDGKDLVGQAGTGTGKTAAFALPVLHRLAEAKAAKQDAAALVLVPTRELAIQVAEAFRKYGKSIGLQAIAIYGGEGYGEQIRALKRGVDVVVATPGRLADHMRKGTFPHRTISAVILDEADEMFDMGFADEIETILASLPPERQTLLFSATMPPRIARITEKFLRNPVRITVAKAKTADGEKPKVRQTACVVPRGFKPATLARILGMENPTSAIVFCKTRGETEDLTRQLIERGYQAAALHGGMEQLQRDRVMKLFRDETLSILVATDVAARGLDISHLSHVVNYHLPESPEVYVHRSGRVGRAGREGVVLTLIDAREQHALKAIERLTTQPIQLAKVPTVAQLKARQLERTMERIVETIEAGDADEFKPMLEKLSKGHDATAIVLAALHLAHHQGRPVEEEQEIPDVAIRQLLPPSRPMGRPGQFNDGPPPNNRRPQRHGMARLFFSLGRDAGVTPRDLVGAIANEAGLSSRDIGAIEIGERYSLVDVVEEASDYVIETLNDSRIKGRKVGVRRDRDPVGARR